MTALGLSMREHILRKYSTSALCGLGRGPYRALSWVVLWTFEIPIPRTGRDAVAADLLDLRQRLWVDLAVMNAENASHGFGLSPDMARTLFVIGLEQYYRARERSRRNPERQPLYERGAGTAARTSAALPSGRPVWLASRKLASATRRKESRKFNPMRSGIAWE